MFTKPARFGYGSQPLNDQQKYIGTTNKRGSVRPSETTVSGETRIACWQSTIVWFNRPFLFLGNHRAFVTFYRCLVGKTIYMNH